MYNKKTQYIGLGHIFRTFLNSFVGMDFQRLFQFLEELQANNHKEWMDSNRAYYLSVREDYRQWLDEMNTILAGIDPDYTDTPAKKGMNRINNNLLFHPNRPVYKDHFGAGLDQQSKQGDFYIQLGLSGSFVAGGYYHPDAATLSSIRDAIDYNGEDLKSILSKQSFKKMFTSLFDDGRQLKKAPKGYANDHEHIDLLKHRSFAVECPLSREEILSTSFSDRIIAIYQEMLPFRRYLNQAVSV
jgi:uncharacterized protein (TIGR02453 family)